MFSHEASQFSGDDMFNLDPRLQNDTHVFGSLGLSRLLLMNDSRYPWFILVPRLSTLRRFIICDQSIMSSYGKSRVNCPVDGRPLQIR